MGVVNRFLFIIGNIIQNCLRVKSEMLLEIGGTYAEGKEHI